IGSWAVSSGWQPCSQQGPFKNADGKYISPFHDIPLFAGSKEVYIFALSTL
uniref:Uncharacterized protein n=1 Tax=Phasianus colchicus TaxID=9054 RepID=A0A669QN65_PHACC